MNYDDKRIAGLLSFVGGAQFILAIIISEALHSGYSIRYNAISDLGSWSYAGNYAAIFNASAIVLGIFGIAAACFIHRIFKKCYFTSLLIMTSIGVVGVGVFAEDIPPIVNGIPLIHAFFAVLAFVFAGVLAIASHKFEKSPLSYVSIILGAVALSAFFLSYILDINSILGGGGMERLVAYPSLLWLLGFGAHLIGDSTNAAEATAGTPK